MPAVELPFHNVGPRLKALPHSTALLKRVFAVGEAAVHGLDTTREMGKGISTGSRSHGVYEGMFLQLSVFREDQPTLPTIPFPLWLRARMGSMDIMPMRC
ncbi:hypothetical protein EV131_114129 [Rhizobium laguerreae]|jgi:hypothetical protein|uniref:Uncharacterized protein n=1 Tax=Rhizobium laguerreae TaxID=1076926 RepID=A0AAX2QFK1_9HYPH|nr:hypothetical protein EV131_114129 [Rhizobium laguerreae]